MPESELVYKTSVTGTYHSENQDAYAVLPLPGGGFAAAVADGVGACSRSALGAAIAASTAVEEAAAGYEPGMDSPAVRALLLRAFHSALSAVCRQAEKDGLPDTEYDTTLTLCIFDDNGRLAWGQAGDSGLVVRDEDGGAYRVLTQQQQEGRYVLPLASGPSIWAFGECRARACLLCSDGVLDLLVRPLVGLNQDLARLFLDRTETQAELPALEKALTRWLEGLEEWSDDDKTIVTIFTPGEGGSSDGDDDHTQDRPDEGRPEAQLG